MVKTALGSKPGLSERKPMKLRKRRPAPASSIMDRATSPTSSAPRNRPASRLGDAEVLSRPAASSAEERSAGISANSTAQAADTLRVNARTDALSPTLERRG